MHNMNGMNWSLKTMLTAVFLALVIVMLAACGPAGGSSDAQDSALDASEELLSILGVDAATDEEIPSTPTPQSEKESLDVEPVADGSGTQDDSEGTLFLTDSSEYDANGLQVGFTKDGHPYRGNPNAPVVIQEYSDYQCPFCSRFYVQTLPDLLEGQIASGDAVLIYYDFPLSNIHPQASGAANAARCAGDQGAAAYWAMHDVLFSSLDEWSVSNAEDVFVSYAEELGLDLELFEECVAEDRYAPEIQADLVSGQRLGVTGTPTFFLNGQSLVGAQPLDKFVSSIDTIKNGGRLVSDQPQQQAPAAAPTPAAFTGEYAGAMGDPGAPVTIVEFTDYQCPYCSQHSLQTLPRIVAEFIETGRVYYMLKDLPLDQLHPDARAAAEAARCAGDQDAYWEMHDEIFANQSQWAGQGEAANELFVDYAGELGLDEGQMTACLESSRYADAVEANVAEARALGISGTPMFYVDGYPLNGARPFEHFQLAIQYAEEGTLADAYKPPETQAQQPSAPPSPVDVDIDDAHFIGDPDAPITIVEFTDFQCPFCVRHFQQTFPQIVDTYVETGIVRYVFKDFPLNSIHAQAAEAAEAARCAGDQNAYVEMHDMLFQRQMQWSDQTPTTLFVGYAESLGLDAGVFEECLTSGRYAAAVDADLDQGIRLGVTGTPAFFINGYLVTGAQPFSLFQQAIESLLAEQQG